MNNGVEYRALVTISDVLRKKYLKNSRAWDNSPFAWIKHRPSRSIGAIGEKIVSMWLAMHDFNVSRSNDTEADRLVEGIRTEIKFSTLWENGNYCFQQIRDQKYDLLLLLGISPHDAHCWVLKKRDIIDLWKIKHVISGQHTGQQSTETAWIQVPPNTKSFLSPYGGTLEIAIERLAALTGFRPTPLSESLDEP